MLSTSHILLVLVVVVLLFGTNKLRTLGSDLGASIKGFKKAMGDEDKSEKEKDVKALPEQDSKTDGKP